MQQLYDLLKLYGDEKYVSFDLGLVSKYHYYTGIIFKAYTYGIGDAIVKGGRYNHLLQKFGKDASAIGFVAVVDEMVESMDRQKIVIPVEENKQVIYYKKENYKEQLAETMKLREQGVAVALVPERQ